MSIARILIERVLQTPLEAFMEFIVVEGDRLGHVLAVFSATEWLAKLSLLDRRQSLTELSELPRVVLLAERSFGRALGAPCVPREPGTQRS